MTRPARGTSKAVFHEVDCARQFHEVRGYIEGVSPRLVGVRNDEDAPETSADRCEGDAQVVCPHEASGPDARDDVFKDSAHAIIVTIRLLRSSSHPAGRAGVNYPGGEYCYATHRCRGTHR